MRALKTQRLNSTKQKGTDVAENMMSIARYGGINFGLINYLIVIDL